MKSLEANPKDDNSQLLYGLIILAKETGKRMDEVSPLIQGAEPAYWWVDHMPQLKERKEALYPEEAKAKKAEGTVLSYVLVDEKGTVRQVIVVTPSEESNLNASAETAARGCTFIPGTLRGESVKVWARLPYEFKVGE
jgi:TonB family protein